MHLEHINMSHIEDESLNIFCNSCKKILQNKPENLYDYVKNVSCLLIAFYWFYNGSL